MVNSVSIDNRKTHRIARFIGERHLQISVDPRGGPHRVRDQLAVVAVRPLHVRVRGRRGLPARLYSLLHQLHHQQVHVRVSDEGYESDPEGSKLD